MVHPAQRQRRFAPGDKLGKYELIRQIAVGGMAELYLARTVGIEGFEKLVVVKRILPQHVANSSFVNMFLNEARLAATLHHPNIAQVYDIGLEDGDYFFAMEYVHGEDLHRILTSAAEQGVPISLDVALTLIAGLCSGLHYAHEKAGPEGKPLDIVHRDVSPSNVIVSYDGAVKLVDFGIARATSRQQTTQGGLKGKIAYMSPEQCRSKAALDRRSDLFSVGTLLYELTTGQLPFHGETEYQVLDQIVNNDVPLPTKIVPGYPPALEKIVLRALARDPERRYSTAVQLQGDVEDFAHETRLRVSPLVLARLMSSLFPARLEEWDNAKTQGAFFVEQHVVQTLIESGKTPDPADPVARVAIKAAAAQLAKVDRAGDADSSVTTALHELAPDTIVGPPPMLQPRNDPARIPTPVPGSGYVPPPLPLRAPMRPTPPPAVMRIPTPRPGSLRMPTPPPGALRVAPPPPPVVPNMPGAIPIVAAPNATPNAGTLVSSSAPPANDFAPMFTPPHIDLTERVRVPPSSRRPVSETSYVDTGKKRRPLVVVMGGLIVIGGAIAAFVATRDDTVVSSRAPPATVKPAAVKVEPPTPEPAPTPEPVAKPAEPEPAAAQPPEPAPEPPKPEVVEHKTPPPPPHRPHTPRVVHATPKPRVDPKPVEPTEPKETKTWNADSPFMPVRTDKH